MRLLVMPPHTRHLKGFSGHTVACYLSVIRRPALLANSLPEFFAKDAYPDAQFKYGLASQQGWDILVCRSGQDDHRIQVKTVSCYSTTSRVSPIHPGWHELYLMRLNKRFLPEAFWIVNASGLSWAPKKLQHKTMPSRNGAQNTGSREFRNAIDRFDDLRCSIEAMNPGLKWDYPDWADPGNCYHHLSLVNSPLQPIAPLD